MLAHRDVHIPGAAQPGIKHHQIACTESDRLTAIWRDRAIPLQQQTGLLLVVGPGEGADPTAPGWPARRANAPQLRRIWVGGHRDGAGHGNRR